MGVGVGCSVDTKFHENISIDFDEVRCISLQKRVNLAQSSVCESKTPTNANTLTATFHSCINWLRSPTFCCHVSEVDLRGQKLRLQCKYFCFFIFDFNKNCSDFTILLFHYSSTQSLVQWRHLSHHHGASFYRPIYCLCTFLMLSPTKLQIFHLAIILNLWPPWWKQIIIAQFQMRAVCTIFQGLCHKVYTK